jgi:hypothetical protein
MEQDMYTEFFLEPSAKVSEAQRTGLPHRYQGIEVVRDSESGFYYFKAGACRQTPSPIVGWPIFRVAIKQYDIPGPGL